MNIKNRLKRLHSQVIKGDSEFCACPGEILTEVWIPHFDGEKYVPKLSGEPLPDNCPVCRKPIEKHIITVEYVKP